MLARLNRLAWRLDPATILTDLGFAEPLGWQVELLRSSHDKVLINAHRQSGKSTAAGALALWTALIDPGSLTLIISASQRQANELFLKVKGYHRNLGEPIPATEDNAVTMRFANDSRIVSLPDSIDTIVGYSGPRLIIIDEASRVSDETYLGVRPMLVRSRGRLVAVSTPRGQRGWWHAAWFDTSTTWDRVRYPVDQNHQIDPEYLEEEKRLLGPRWYAQEYMCSFEENHEQFFLTSAIDAAFDDDAVLPLFA